MSKVYLVGDKNAPKTNSWASMTNSWEAAEKLLKDMGPTATHKVLDVQPPRGKR